MKSRDKAINALGERFAVAKKARSEKEVKLLVQQKRYEAQQKENVEVQSRSDLLGRVISRKREELLIVTAKLADFKDELESLKNELTSSAELLVTKRSENANRSQDLEEKRILLERQRTKYQVAKQRLESAKTSTVRAEESAKAAEDGLVEKEREFNQHLARIKVLKEQLIKETQKVFELKTSEERMRSNIQGTKSTSRNLDVQLHGLDKDAAKQQELLYNAEFQIQQIERKIARGMGERSDEEKRNLKASIEELEAQVEVVKENRKMLQAQVNKFTPSQT